jgi:hypothetical protein
MPKITKQTVYTADQYRAVMRKLNRAHKLTTVKKVRKSGRIVAWIISYA